MRHLIRILAVAALAALGSVGCKSACEKMGAKVVDCMEDYCSEHGDSPACTEEASEAGRTAIAERTGGECTGQAEEQANAALELSCEALTGTILRAYE